MNKNLELLRNLQEMDTKLRDLERQRREAPAHLADSQRLVEQRQSELAALEGRAKESLAHVEAQNLELKTKEEQRKKLRTQLNTVRTNKEYSAIQQEIAGIEADMSRLEDKILQMMTDEDKAKERTTAAHANLEAAKAEHARLEAEVAEVLGRCEKEAASIQRLRNDIRPQIHRDYLEPYDRLLNRRDGIALVRATGEVCQGCFMSLPPQTRASLLLAERPVFCSSCGRMLYLDDEE